MSKFDIKYIFISCLFLYLFLLITGCGTDYHINTTQPSESVSEFNPTGYYYMELGGEIEVFKDFYERVSIVHTDYLTSTNPSNSTYAMHPKVNISDRFLTQSNTIVYSRDVNYNSGHDVEADSNGANITGLKRTDFEYNFGESSITVTIKIFSDSKVNNPNNILATRVLRGSL